MTFFLVGKSWVAEHERKERKFPKAKSLNEEALSPKGKGLFILELPRTRGDDTMVVIKYLRKNLDRRILESVTVEMSRGERRLRYRDSSS
jgi:hypothetical protein